MCNIYFINRRSRSISLTIYLAFGRYLKKCGNNEEGQLFVDFEKSHDSIKFAGSNSAELDGFFRT